MAEPDDASHGIVPGRIVHESSTAGGSGADDGTGVGASQPPVRLSARAKPTGVPALAPLDDSLGHQRRGAAGGGSESPRGSALSGAKHGSGAAPGRTSSPVTRLKLPLRPSPGSTRRKQQPRFKFGDSSEERKARASSDRQLAVLGDSDVEEEGESSRVALAALNATPGLAHHHTHSLLTRLMELLLPMSVLHAWQRSEVRTPGVYPPAMPCMRRCCVGVARVTPLPSHTCVRAVRGCCAASICVRSKKRCPQTPRRVMTSSCGFGR